jgi:competence protein ComEA
MGFRLTTQERRIVVFVGLSLVAGGATKLALRPAQNVSPTLQPADAQSRPPGIVDLNTANARDLQRLPGIGPELASRIVAYRRENGPFRSIDQLTDVRGVGPKSVARLRSLVTVVASEALDTSAGPGLDR